jgi:ligand-binding sensor domain-containing protein/DNA-binding CsgD family transcriptional regulator
MQINCTLELRRQSIRNLISWSFVFISTILYVRAQSDFGLPFIRYYSSQDYQAGIQNWHIAQDERGIIYTANNFGLLEFDGTTWRLYPVVNGVKVRHFAFRPDNSIAVASQGQFGYFKIDNQGLWIYQSISDSLPEGERDFEETWKVFHLDGSDYFCTTNKIFKVQNEEIEIIRSDYGMDNFFLINRQIFVYMPDAGLSMLSKGQLININNQEQILNKWVAQLIPMANNRMLMIMKENGAFIIDALSNSIWQPDEQETLVKASVNTAIKLRNGNYAIGTQNSGLLIYSPEGELKNHLTKDKGLENRTIICLFEDRQGNLWVGHNNGISYMEFGQPFSFLNEHLGLPGTGYDGIQIDNALYLATNNGLYINVNSPGHAGTEFELVPNSEGQAYYINSIGNIFLMGHHNGPYVFTDGGNPRRLGEEGTWLFQRLNEQEDYLISGTYEGLELFQQGPGTLQFMWQINGFEESCRIFEQDDSGNIWMTHGYKGVFRFKLSDDLKSIRDMRFYGVEDGLPSNLLICVYCIRNELVFTTVDGIYRYNEATDSFVKDAFYTEFFEQDTPINVLAEDATGNIYFLGQTEIGVLNKEPTGKFVKKTDSFNKIKGMLNDDLQNISILQNNLVLYGAKEGFIIYDPVKDLPVQYQFDALIRSATLTGHSDSTIFYGNVDPGMGQIDSIAISGIQELPYEHNSLRFEYSANFMDGLDMTTYQYRLHGFDEDWSDWERNNQKEYTNLFEGNYVFQVRASNISGQVSPASSFRFKIKPPWFRTTLAYATYISLFAILFTSLIGAIIKRHKREKSEMLLKQKSELNRRDTELESIKSESEKEIEKLKNDKLLADINHKNKELASTTMHLINKNEFITHVKQDLTSLVRNNPKDPLTKELGKIMDNIDRNISDDEWQHFENHFDQVHGDFSKRIKDEYPDLSPQERRLCAYLRMNMTSKEIANLLNITVRGVEISRYRLRKKLQLTRDVNLAEFILNF